MAVEGENQGEGIMPLGICNGLANNLLVTEVHPVEEAHGQTDFAVPGLKFMRCADNVHAVM